MLGGGDAEEVEVQSGVGTLPSRDLTGLLGLYVSALGPVLCPNRSLIPPLFLVGEFAGAQIASGDL